jgi:hypothetical protein
MVRTVVATRQFGADSVEHVFLFLFERSDRSGLRYDRWPRYARMTWTAMDRTMFGRSTDLAGSVSFFFSLHVNPIKYSTISGNSDLGQPR